METKFEILTLNEGNVNRIYNDCLVTDSTMYSSPKQLYKNNPNHIMRFDREKTLVYNSTIHYLIGQLDDVHQGKDEMSLRSSIIRYDKKLWTKDMETLIHFYYLGMGVSRFSSIDDDTKTIKLSPITPTLSPEDPNFKQWLITDGKEWKEELGQEPSDD